jgi:hypothetical protein
MGGNRSGHTALMVVVIMTAVLLVLLTLPLNPAPLRDAFTPAAAQQD